MTRCLVMEGRFVEPCSALARQIGYGIRGGLELVTLSDFKSGRRTRSFVVLGGNRARDIKSAAINCCPFCGERIDAPMKTTELL